MTVENFQSCKHEKSQRPLTSWEHRTYFDKLSRQIVWRELSKIVGGDQIGQPGLFVFFGKKHSTQQKTR